MPDAFVQAGLDAGLDPSLAAYMPRYIHIESGGNPRAQTGSYIGLLQMGPDEIKRYGGNGLSNGAQMYADRARWFQNQYGRAPTPTELYLVNQQGQGGLSAHMANPDAPAWTNMYSTAEGRQKGAGWAREAIWGNVPDDLKKQYGSVDNITSQQFMDMWRHKVEGSPLSPASYASASPPSSSVSPAVSSLAAGNAPASTEPAPQPATSGSDPRSRFAQMAQSELQEPELQPAQFPAMSAPVVPQGALNLRNALNRLMPQQQQQPLPANVSQQLIDIIGNG